MTDDCETSLRSSRAKDKYTINQWRGKRGPLPPGAQLEAQRTPRAQFPRCFRDDSSVRFRSFPSPLFISASLEKMVCPEIHRPSLHPIPFNQTRTDGHGHADAVALPADTNPHAFNEKFRAGGKRQPTCKKKISGLLYTDLEARLRVRKQLQPADIGWPTGNGKKLSNCQACCLSQLCLGAA